MKKVLILCTGNSCRSIIAEAIINAKFGCYIQAYSSGVKASGLVNKNAKKILIEKNIWKDSYYSKTLDEVIDINFDLVITVCDNAKESCPIFPKKTQVVHIGFEDPDGKSFSVFKETYNLIEKDLLKFFKKYLNMV